MSAFLKAFEEVHDGEPSIAFRKFADVIQTDRYAEKYGDIPRRPLFLQMLAEDAWSGSDPEKQLFRLYGKYFRAKLRRDWE